MPLDESGDLEHCQRTQNLGGRETGCDGDFVGSAGAAARECLVHLTLIVSQCVQRIFRMRLLIGKFSCAPYDFADFLRAGDEFGAGLQQKMTADRR